MVVVVVIVDVVDVDVVIPVFFSMPNRSKFHPKLDRCLFYNYVLASFVYAQKYISTLTGYHK